VSGKSKYLPSDVVAAFNPGSENAGNMIMWLRQNCDQETVISTLRRIPLNANNNSNTVFGNLFPEEFSKMFSKRYKPISSIEKAIGWNIATFKIYQEKLRNHTELRDSYYKSIICGNFDSAEMLAQTHQDELGKTFWSLAQEFLLPAEKFGTETNVERRTRFCEANKGKMIATIAAALSVRAEKSVSIDKYHSLLKITFGDNNQNHIHVFINILLSPRCTPLQCDIQELLGLLEVLPLVDRYELFCRIALLAIAQGHEQSKRFQRAVLAISEITKDQPVTYASQIITQDPLQKLSIDNSELLNAWDLYVAGKYGECASVAIRVAESNPLCLQAHELFVKASLYSGKQPDDKCETILTNLWHHLNVVYDKSELTEFSLRYLSAIAIRFNDLSLTYALLTTQEIHSSHSANPILLKLSGLTCRMHSPRNLEPGFQIDANTSYLRRLNTAAERRLSTNFFMEAFSGEKDILEIFKDSVPAARIRFFKGLASLQKGCYNSAVSEFESFIETVASGSCPYSPFAIEEARVCEVTALTALEGVEKLLQVVVDSYLERAQSIKRLPLSSIYKTCFVNRSKIRGSIYFPILTYLACDDPHVVSMPVSAFLKTWKVDKPSQLPINEFGSKSQNILFVFLHKVCALEVLDSLSTFNSTSEVEAERIAILRKLPEIDALRDIAKIQEEVLRITQAAELRSALHRIESSRVEINVTGIREAEASKFRESFLFFSAFREIIPQIENIELKPLGWYDEKMRPLFSANVEDLRRLISAKEGKVRLFEIFLKAFLEVKDVFLNSPQFGLDACLSVRIRHGILAQHIRRPFEEQNLMIDPLDTATTNSLTHLEERLQLPKYLNHVLSEILQNISISVNQIAEEFKNTWVQVATEANNKCGLFDYTYSNEEIAKLYLEKNFLQADYKEFIDKIFDELLEKTKINLHKARKHVTVVLAQQLQGIISDAEERAKGLATAIRYSLLQDALSRCRNEVHYAIQNMEFWFTGTDAALIEDISLRLAVSTAAGMAERLYPDVRNKITVGIDSDYVLRGRMFSPFVHLMFFLIDNAIKHSGLPTEDFSINASVVAKNNVVSIIVSNTLAPETSAELCAVKINSTIEQIRKRSDFTKVKSEGGTGLVKVIATVCLEFGCKNYEVAASHSSDNRLDIKVKFDAGAIIA
jgi:polyhydroxyalkanoate synthesis regulator phasin